MAAVTKFPEPLVFGLDIGTRSIVGTVGYRDGKQFHIVAQCVKYHDTRAMMDGQIHDINKVGEEIVYVKENLEQQLQGRKLKEVCIAAAGRVLKTSLAKADYDFTDTTVVTQEYIHSLEMLGVETAHEQMLKENDTDVKFFCVGYTVVKYFLNDFEISNLEGHKAHKIGAEVLATFLPEEVVDGLYAAVALADLEIANMTLEPIAAIQVAIPDSYRLLNIALVDVGAGTSDICITKDGTIVGYGMLPKAGDEITEKLIKEYLVDFATAEKIKMIGPRKKNLVYKDIMGVSQKVTPQEVYDKVNDTVDSITEQIAKRIVNLNGDKPVSAVFVVGGGGKIPGFTDKLAAHLDLPSERVALRGEEVLGFVDIHVEDVKKDPLLVTPIGICLNFYDQKNRFIYLTVNEERVKLYDTDKLTVFDAALAYGLSNDAIFPKRGADLNYTLNGKKKFVRGKAGEPAVITLNDVEVGMNHLIQAGDRIQIIESTSGEDAKAVLNEVADLDATISFVVNDVTVNCPKVASVNGKLESEFYELNEGDKIDVLNYYTLSQLMQFMDIETPHEVFVNGARAGADTKIYENFNVAWIDKEEAYKAQRFVEDEVVEDDSEVDESDMASSLDNSLDITQETVTLKSVFDAPIFDKSVSGKAAVETSTVDDTTLTEIPPKRNLDSVQEILFDQPGTTSSAQMTKQDLVNQWIENAHRNAPDIEMRVSVNGKNILLTGKSSYVFVDVFDKYEFDLKNVRGSKLVQTIDGAEAQHFSPLHNGAVVEIYWKE
ncbi:MAG: rod shape-determining protein [Lachnospiraceae bacterium]|nr:rod shape-determining protein [Lachnospiraceae bacterium]